MPSVVSSKVILNIFICLPMSTFFEHATDGEENLYIVINYVGYCTKESHLAKFGLSRPLTLSPHTFCGWNYNLRWGGKWTIKHKNIYKLIEAIPSIETILVLCFLKLCIPRLKASPHLWFWQSYLACLSTQTDILLKRFTLNRKKCPE